MTSDQRREGPLHLVLFLTPEARRESPVVLIQGTPAPSSPVPCVRPSSLRYSPARITTDLPAAEAWDTTPDVAGA